jgi:hypothetical protein
LFRQNIDRPEQMFDYVKRETQFLLLVRFDLVGCLVAHEPKILKDFRVCFSNQLRDREGINLLV